MNVEPQLSDEDKTYLIRCASIRKTSLTVLYQKLIEMIARDQLVLAVLDDDSQPFQGKTRRVQYPDELFLGLSPIIQRYVPSYLAQTDIPP